MMNVKLKIKDTISEVLEKRCGVKDLDFSVEYPRDDKFGDYATNAAMILAKRLKQNPMTIGQEMVNELEEDKEYKKIFAKTDIVKPGFINFFLNNEVMIDCLAQVIGGKYKDELKTILQSKKYLLEHTSANPVHTIHIGHLRNNFIGMSVYRILKSLGAKVVLDYIDNNRGMNVTRAMLGYLIFADKRLIKKDKNYVEKLKGLKLSDQEIGEIVRDFREVRDVGGFQWKEVLREWVKEPGSWLTPGDLELKADHFDLCIYSPGARAAKDYEFIQNQVQEMLVAWEQEDNYVRKLWQTITDWSWQGFNETFNRLGSKIDHIWHESEIYNLGKAWVDKGLKLGVFRKLKDGAVISDLENFNLTDVVLLKSSGASLYHTQDFGLTELKLKTYKNFDKYIWCIGNDQKLYFQQLFKMIEQLRITKEDQLLHLNYGFVRLKSGKMSSRLGTVVNADDLMNTMKEKTLAIIESSKTDRGLSEGEKSEIAEQVMLAGLKYGLLKYSRERDFDFDIDESLSLSGNSGPYIQYVYARCQSILKRVKDKKNKIDKIAKDININNEERSLLKILNRTEEVIVDAAELYAPHIICDYLYKLAQEFNSFYEKYKVIGSGEKEEFRINLTKAISEVLNFDLDLLGISVINKM